MDRWIDQICRLPELPAKAPCAKTFQVRSMAESLDHATPICCGVLALHIGVVGRTDCNYSHELPVHGAAAKSQQLTVVLNRIIRVGVVLAIPTLITEIGPDAFVNQGVERAKRVPTLMRDAVVVARTAKPGRDLEASERRNLILRVK